MTIKGLVQFLHKKIPNTLKQIDDIQSFRGKKFIIDGTFYIYKFMYVAWKHIIKDKNREKKFQSTNITTHILIRHYIIQKSIELLKNQHEYFKSLNISTLYIIEDINERLKSQPLDYKCKKHIWKERELIRKKKNLFDILNVDSSKYTNLKNEEKNSIKESNGIITAHNEQDQTVNYCCDKKIGGKPNRVQLIVDPDGVQDLFTKNIFIKINSKTANDIYNYLLFEKIPIFITKNDAEKECAIQCSHEKDFVVSDDIDALAFGAPNLIRFISNKKKRHIINKEQLLKELKINYEQFIDLCILSGCDYSAKIPGIGPVKAHEIIQKYENIENFLESKSFNKYKNSKLFHQKLLESSMSFDDYIENEFTFEQARKIFLNSY